MRGEMAPYFGLYEPNGASANIPEPKGDCGRQIGRKLRLGPDINGLEVVGDNYATFKLSGTVPLANRDYAEHERQRGQTPVENDLQIVAICYEGAYWAKLRIYFGYFLLGLAVLLVIVSWIVGSFTPYTLTSLAIFGVGLILGCLSAVMTEPC